MKVSKVNHKKAGISGQPVEAGGMLYSYPGKAEEKRKEAELTDYIRNLNKKAQNLYNLFTPCTDKDKSITDAFTLLFRKILIKPISEGGTDEQIVDNIKRITQKRILVKTNTKPFQKEEKAVREWKTFWRITDPVDKADRVVNGYLRQSLRRSYTVNKEEKSVYIPDVIKKICIAALSGEACDREIEQIDRTDLLFAIKGIRADYTKEEQIAKIAKSIECQNVPVQIGEDGKHLVLSSAYNDKKKYIFEFMKEYAGCEKEQQKELLKHMHYLILLYVYGEQIADEARETDLRPFSFGISLKENDGVISETLLDLIRTRDNTPSRFKTEIRGYNDQIAIECKDILVQHYQQAVNAEGISDTDRRWINFISDRVAAVLKGKRLTEEKLCKSYLCKKIWEEWTAYIARKYIDLGKGVYYFAMDDVDKVTRNEPANIGQAADQYRDGISSFDYERNKAEEAMKRALSRYVSFAVNHFDESVRSSEERQKGGKEDILFLNKNEIIADKNVKKNILRYFGGASGYAGSEIESMDDIAMIFAIKEQLSAARNSCFHFMAGESKAVGREVVEILLRKEYASVGAVYRKRYYSNNVPGFYAETDINMLMDRLYTAQKPNMTQIPSFNKVIARKGNPYLEFVGAFLDTKSRSSVLKAETADIYRSTLYFLLKEIYYYDFLRQSDMMKRFRSALDTAHIRELKRASRHEQEARKNAYESFCGRADLLQEAGLSFGEFCQEIMTEYNLQNNQKAKKPSGVKVKIKKKDGTEEQVIKAIEDNTQIYKHYRTLLYLGIREAFFTFIRENIADYGFLKKPEDRMDRIVSEESFCQSWHTDVFLPLREHLLTDMLFSSWYVTAHFLDPKNLNHLIGIFKNYIQFRTDIEKRARITGNRTCDTYMEETEKYTKLVEILEFVKLYCGQVSNCIEDYFEDNEAYAKYISCFVDYGNPGIAELRAFCAEVPEANYYDGLNPVPNRNIVLSTMYGNREILENTMQKITEKDFKQFSKKKKELSGLFEKGVCENKEDQQKLKQFQNMKNRLEFVDVLVMTELMNDLYGQLVSYSCLRERDLMFMQLGFYYTKLFYTDSIPAQDKLRVLQGDCDIRDGAVLYQLMALYNYDQPVYKWKEGKATESSERQISGKINVFTESYCDSAEEYDNGLCFFEDVDGRHGEYILLRNYIDHFKYFANHEKSLLEMYGSMYGGFFSYDTKLKKSVSYILPNILLSYFVNVQLEFGRREVPGKNGSHTTVCLGVKDIKSDYFTYKPGQAVKIEKETEKPGSIDIATCLADSMMVGGIEAKDKIANPKKQNRMGADRTEQGNPYQLAAREKRFLEEVEALLAYKKE